MKKIYIILVASVVAAGCVSTATSPEDTQAHGLLSPEAVGTLDEAQKGNTGPLVGLLSALGPYGQAAAGLIGLMTAFPRSRKHLVASAQSLGKAVGLGHTSQASKEAANG